MQNKFLSNDSSALFVGKEILVITESHFAIRTKCPDNFILIARSVPRESKAPRGGVAIYKRSTSTLELKLICDKLYDMVVVEVEDTSAIIVAAYIPPSNTKYYTDIYFENLRLLVDTFTYSKQLFIFGDLNARISNNFPNNGYTYLENPDRSYNQSGRMLVKILNEFKDLVIINGMCYKDQIMDSRFTFLRGARQSQIDLALSNTVDAIQTFKICKKLPQSDHCPYIIEVILDSSPPLHMVDECAIGFRSYEHYDISKRIRKAIDIRGLNITH